MRRVILFAGVALFALHPASAFAEGQGACDQASAVDSTRLRSYESPGILFHVADIVMLTDAICYRPGGSERFETAPLKTGRLSLEMRTTQGGTLLIFRGSQVAAYNGSAILLRETSAFIGYEMTETELQANFGLELGTDPETDIDDFNTDVGFGFSELEGDDPHLLIEFEAIYYRAPK